MPSVILLDAARWPAHGRLWGHVVSDATLDELHRFAAVAGIPPGGFDHDHYDYPAERRASLIEAGAELVDSRVLLRRLRASGLRVRPHERTPTRGIATARLRERWRSLAPRAPALGEDLLTRWSEPHRRYHDVRHLLHLLETLEALGAAEPVVRWAAWFHDAVHEGRAGDDERASAALARDALASLLPAADVAEVVRLVELTIDHSPGPSDARGVQLSDADLAILGAPRGRYDVYARDVRAEYAHVADAAFVRGRTAVLEGLLAAPVLFVGDAARDAFEDRARGNMAAEVAPPGRPSRPPGSPRAMAHRRCAPLTPRLRLHE